MLQAHEGSRPLLVELALKVQTYDIDFANHVNNQVYVRWLEDLRMELLRVYYPLEQLMTAGVAPILASTHIVYRRSIGLFDEPIGRMWCVEMGRATLSLHAEIVVEGHVCATAVQRGILLRLGTTKPARIPEGLAEAFARTSQT
jgi:acyl-CoA thioester hydrolase